MVTVRTKYGSRDYKAGRVMFKKHVGQVRGFNKDYRWFIQVI